MRPLSVVHIDGEGGLRGGERQLLYLAAALRARGHSNRVVGREGAPLIAEARKQGFETTALPLLGELDLLSAWHLARAGAGVVLHAHTAHAAALARWAGLLGARRVVLHRRVDFPISFPFGRLKYGGNHPVIAVSAAVRDLLSGQGLDAARVHVVPDGIPVGPEEAAWAGVPEGRFAPPSAEERRRLRETLARDWGLDPSAPWIGNLAALVPHKDHDNLLAAALIVLLKRPKAVFLVAGDGPEGPRLRSAVRRMGLEGRVLFLGRLEDPLPLLKSLDVFALSSWGEGMGSVLLEAAACAIPIAATAAGGIPEIVTSGESGLLCPPRSPERLAENLLALLDDRALARHLADRARRELSRFSLSCMAERMEKIYERA